MPAVHTAAPTPLPRLGGQPSWRRALGHPTSLTRWVVVGAAVAVAVAWAAVAAALLSMRHDALEADREHRANLARALQEQTVRVLAATDQATLRLSEAVNEGGQALADIGRFANETGLAPKILTQLSLVGADGRFQGSNLDPDGSRSGHVDLSTREHVRVHLNPALAKGAPPVAANGLFIGKPVLGKVSGKWTIQLSRRIDSPDGRPLGVVVASLDPLYFEDTYRGVSLGSGGAVSLVGSDLTLRARVIGGRSDGMGQRFDAAGPTPFQADGGEFDSLDPETGNVRHHAYRQVAAYPLYVVVARGEDEALASWRSVRGLALALTALLTAAVVGAASLFAVGVRRLEASNAALRASEAEAQAANQAKTQFLAAISHELRTPLTSIRGFAELMEQRLPEPRQREQAGLIRKAAEYLNRLLTEILDLVKVEAGAMQVDRGDVALRPLIDGAADFFGVTAADKGLQLLLRLPGDLPATVPGDELRLKQILNNLLSNAFKFTQAGHVAIEADHDAHQLRLHVVDTGPGIPPYQHELIFEHFRQGDASVSYQHGGTGLGLALSRALAELMGGTLTVRSSVGAGARFTLTLPRG
ncbi:MAG: two-component sensor histidine kinase [Burkholderiaceae bacterium]|nr:two-component sensor histidine kinase [Burkholderiaceae bacterium]